MDYSTSQMVLDICGDLFSMSISIRLIEKANKYTVLVIPLILIWQIRIRWTQKIALVLTLCLTVVMIGITIARIVGLTWEGKLDSVWETYFIVVAAEIGLTLVAVTAFRALYVSKAKNRNVQKTITTLNWYQKGKSAVVHLISKATGKTDWSSIDDEKKDGQFIMNDIPRATMTGMGTFIDKNGKEGTFASQSCTSSVTKQDV